MTSSTLSFFGLKGRDPRRQTSAERRIANERRHRSQPATTDMCISLFSASLQANRLSVIEPSGPIPPVVATTSGVKSPCSTLRMRSRYSRFFLFSCIAKQLARLLPRLLRANGEKAVTSKNARRDRDQNPSTRRSLRASSSLLADLCWNVSPFKAWSSGSHSTS